MWRYAPVARLTLGIVIALLAILQLAATAQAEAAHERSATHAGVCAAADHLPRPEGSADHGYSIAAAHCTRDAIRAHAALRGMAHPAAAPHAFGDFDAAPARASRLSRHVSEAPNLSIVLLNLRQ